ncbi:hypothetical protein B0H13DRAFT_2458344, partial [Mycena leptocephala]
DSTNYSCVYDALFTSLACVWAESPELWSQRLIDCNPLLGIWAMAMAQNSLEPERARNVVRMRLHSQDAADFPLGPRGVKLDALFMAIAEGRTYGSAKTYCEGCGYAIPGTIHTFGQYTEYVEADTSEWCNSAAMVSVPIRLPSTKLSYLRTPGNTETNATTHYEVNFPHHNGVTTLKLRGLIYHSQMEGHSIGHFTSVVIDAEGIMWYHDGITTKRTCINNGRFADVASPFTLHRRHNQRLSAAIY